MRIVLPGIPVPPPGEVTALSTVGISSGPSRENWPMTNWAWVSSALPATPVAPLP